MISNSDQINDLTFQKFTVDKTFSNINDTVERGHQLFDPNENQTMNKREDMNFSVRVDA